jgi:hypothetical protein
MLKKLLAAERRTVLRSLVAGLFSHYAAVAALIALLWLLRPFVWAALYGVPYQPNLGPVNPSSSEGTLLQVIGLLSWLPGGFAAAHWSPHRSLRCLLPILSYLACLTLLAVVAGEVPPMSPARTVWYWLSAPTGAILGALFYQATAARQRATPTAAPGEA